MIFLVKWSDEIIISNLICCAIPLNCICYAHPNWVLSSLQLDIGFPHKWSQIATKWDFLDRASQSKARVRDRCICDERNVIRQLCQNILHVFFILSRSHHREYIWNFTCLHTEHDFWLENPVWTQYSVSSSWPHELVASTGKSNAAFSNSGMQRCKKQTKSAYEHKMKFNP